MAHPRQSGVVFAAFGRLLRVVYAAAPGLLVVIVLTAVIQSVVPVVQVYITGLLVDAVSDVFRGGVSYLGAAFTLLGAQLAMTVAGSIVSVAERIVSFRLENRVTLHVETMISRKAINQPLEFFDVSESHDQIQRASIGHAGRGLDLVRSVITLGQRAITVVSLLILIAGFHWLLAVGLAAAVVPAFVVNRNTGALRFGQMQRQTSEQRFTSYLGSLLRGKDSAKEIRLFNIGEYLIARWEAAFRRIADDKYALDRRASLVQFGAEVLGLAAGAIATGGLIWLGALGQVTLGAYVALTQALASAQFQMQTIALTLARLYENALFMTTLLDFLDLPELEQARGEKPFPYPLRNGITVSGLSFSYPNSRRPALQDISFTIAAGERIAIVGENGAGKSTLVKCLLGLYTPTTGTIQYDDVDMTAIRPSDLRANMSAVFQDYVRYYLQLKENIVLGQLERAGDTEAMLEAAERGGAADIVPGLPDGYDTVLGSAFTGGRELSHGQWQKVALSRTLFRQAQVLFLDEPTASIDPAAEAAVFEKFYNLTIGKTAFLVSHRMGSCKIADRILVLKNGKLIEDGSHEQLMLRNGEYANMVRLQAQWSPELTTPSREGSV